MPDDRRSYLLKCMWVSLRKRLWFLLPSGPLVAAVLVFLFNLRVLDAAVLGALVFLLWCAASAYRSYQRHRDDLPSPYRQPS